MAAGKVRFGIGAYNVALAKIDTDLKYREFLEDISSKNKFRIIY